MQPWYLLLDPSITSMLLYGSVFSTAASWIPLVNCCLVVIIPSSPKCCPPLSPPPLLTQQFLRWRRPRHPNIIFPSFTQVNTYVPNSGTELARLDYRVGDKGYAAGRTPNGLLRKASSYALM